LVSSSTAYSLNTHATIITVNPTRDIILDGAILVDGNHIKDIGKSASLAEKYSSEPMTDLSGRIIIPGLISTHMHTAQTLLRG
jgi:cytosine/adenosine deaminase-related metal-dependent hydrolase